MRNYKLLSIIFLVFQLLQSAYAEDSKNILDFDRDCQGRSGNISTLKQEMCSCTSTYLEQLSNKDPDGKFKDELNEVKKLSDELNLLLETKKVISNFKNNFEKMSLPVVSPSEIPAKINQYNQAINSALVLKSIQEIVKLNPKLIEDKNLDFKKLCVNVSDEKYKGICAYVNKSVGIFFQDAPHVATINNFLNYYRSAIEGTDSSLMQSNLDKLISSSVEGKDTEFVITTAETFSPLLLQKINSVSEKIMKCSKIAIEKDKECRTPYLNMSAADNKSLVKEINETSVAVNTQSLGQSKISNLQKADSLLQNLISKKLNDSFNSMKSVTETEIAPRFEANKKFFSDDKNLKEITDLQNKLSSNSTESNKKFVNDFILLRNRCKNDPGNLSILDKESHVNKCSQDLQTIYLEFSEAPIKQANEKLAKAKDDLRIKMNSDKTRRNHLLQNYIANNFLKSCKSTIPVSSDLVSGCGNDILSPLSSFNLGGAIFPIIGKISNANSFDNEFSKEELKEYLTACSGENSKAYRLVCSLIKDDYNGVKTDRTYAEWTAEREKYWISYDPNAEGGYRKVEKKGLGRMFLEAAVPAFTNSIPFMMSNYASSMSIDYMQQQAMAQKQWMWDSTQANNYWMANTFYQVPISTTTPTFTTKNSFNFGN